MALITNRTADSQRTHRARHLIAILAILLPLALALGLTSGAVSLSTGDVLRALSDFLFEDTHSQTAVIIGQIRLPRVLLAAVMGATLAMSGAAMQGLFRNPLADPSLIGVTAGASLGAAMVIVVGGNFLSGYTGLTLVSVGAFAGGVVAVLFVYRLATSSMGTSVAG